MENKANIGVQTIFYILMALLFVWLLIFGIQKIFFVEEKMSEQKRLEIKNELKDMLDACNDPLNKGKVMNGKFSHSSFNMMCFISEGEYRNMSQLGGIYRGGDNVVLAKGTKIQGGSSEELKVRGIKDSFSINYEFNETSCISPLNSGDLEINIECKSNGYEITN